MEKLAVLILAAGLGKRLKLDLPKALLRTGEKELVLHVLESAGALHPERIVMVLGHQKEKVEQAVRASRTGISAPFSFAYQQEQRGTGDAVRAALPLIEDFKGTVLILYGDTPLLRADTLTELLAEHDRTKATVSILSFALSGPNAYGRIVRDAKGFVTKIVEAGDCGPAEAGIREFNTGTYAVDSAFLKPAVESLKNDNAQKEFYLTDIVAKAAGEGQTVGAYCMEDSDEALGVNDLYDLSLVNRSLNARRIKQFLLQGVRIIDPASVFIDPEVVIGPGATIGPQVQLRGKTIIESGVTIEGCAVLSDMTIKSGAKIKLGVSAEKSTVGERAAVGPFAHIREGCILGPETKVGNFVETKKAQLEEGAKASHLTYLGDCTVGAHANIGAGTITCNYDGFKKSRTSIGAGAFIGSNSALVAPVVVGDGAMVGAGSVITQTVEKDSLALARAPQVSKPGYAKRKREANNK